MKGFRFSLWSMFLGVAAVAIVCAALVKPNLIWVLTLQAASLGILTVALLAVLVYERGAARAFWIGFAVVGWGNLGLQRFHLTEVSLTGEVSEWLMDVIHPEPALRAAQQSGVLVDPYVVEAARNAFPYVAVWIGPSLLGVVGGVVAQRLYFRRERLAAGQSPCGSGSR